MKGEKTNIQIAGDEKKYGESATVTGKRQAPLSVPSGRGGEQSLRKGGKYEQPEKENESMKTLKSRAKRDIEGSSSSSEEEYSDEEDEDFSGEDDEEEEQKRGKAHKRQRIDEQGRDRKVLKRGGAPLPGEDINPVQQL